MNGQKYEKLAHEDDNYDHVDSDKHSIDSGEIREAHLDDSAQDVTLPASHTGAVDMEAGADVVSAPGPTRSRDKASRKFKVVAWKDLPRKGQLAMLTMARLSEPLAQTSLQSYMFYQLKWFDDTLSDEIVARQAGILHASFTGCQFLTAMLWGRVADSKWAGRKSVLLIGLLGTLISCVGFGFSTSFYQALFFRCLGGVTNGNVGVIRTMISEIIKEKKYQSRAFLLLPMTFNIGVIIGPILGGLLSDPAGSYPDMFGSIPFFKSFPYALPNLVNAGFLFLSLVFVWLLLEETLDSRRDIRDHGRLLGQMIAGLFRRREPTIAYKPLHSRDLSVGTDITDIELDTSPITSQDVSRPPPKPKSGRRWTTRLPFRRIFTRNVILTLIAHFFLAFHLGTHNAVWFVYLSTPVWNPEKPQPPGFQPQLPFRFTGGLGMPPRSVGMAMALLGFIGIAMQLFLYPKLSGRLGTLRSWRYAMVLFPIAYILFPYLSLVPSTTPPPSQKTGPWIWIALVGFLFIQVTGRTFALPGQTILVNNCTPHPSVLGTVHGLGQSASSFARTIGPVLGGWLYGLGISHGLVGGAFWVLSCVGICGLIVGFWVKEGNGHEIWLDGDEDDEDING